MIPAVLHEARPQLCTFKIEVEGNVSNNDNDESMVDFRATCGCPSWLVAATTAALMPSELPSAMLQRLQIMSERSLPEKEILTKEA